MKRYLILFTTILILSFTLIVPTSAIDKPEITFSEDYKNMYLYGHTYIRADVSMLYYNLYDNSTDDYNYDSYYADCPAPLYYNDNYQINLSKTQKNEIDYVEIIEVNDKETIFLITIHFYDGSELHIDFIIEEFIDEYKKILSGNTDKYSINFMWPDGNRLTVDKNKLNVGDKTKIGAWDYNEEYPIYVKSTDGGFSAELGAIFTINDNYYFYSFIDSDIKNRDDFINKFTEDDEIEVIKLTDKKLLNKIKSCEQKYYDYEYGYLDNNNFTHTVSKIFFIIVFAIAPAIICVVTLILALKSKKALYKKLLFATSGISVAEIITFIYIAFTLFNT